MAVDAVHHRQVRLQGLFVLFEQFHGIDELGIPALDLVAARARTEVARNQVFNAQNLAAALAHELAALAQQVAYGAFVPGVDIPHGQDAQPQQVGQVARVAEIASMLEPVVLLDRGGVDQMYGEASGLKTVNQPVPVECGLHRHAAHLAGAGAQRSHDGAQIVGQSLGVHRSILLVEHGHDAVVAVQVNPRIQFHVGLLCGLHRLNRNPNDANLQPKLPPRRLQRPGQSSSEPPIPQR